MKGRHVVVTGGAGFIGSHLAETLLSRGHAVRVVDNLFTGHRRNVPAGAEFLVFICGEIMTMPGLPKVPAANSIEVNAEGKIVGLF